MARPTGRGLALLATAAATYVAARVVGTWELYLVASSLAAGVLIAWALVAATTRRLEAARTVTPERPTAGDPLSVSLTVCNGSALPGPQVTVPDAAAGLADGDVTLEVETLAPRARRTVWSRPRPARRGVHELPALLARAEDPLGLARATRRLSGPLHVTVYPHLARLASCALYPEMGVRPERGHRGLTSLGATEFRGVRPHQPGEPLSRIDWKATAKTGELMLRETDDPTCGDVALLLHAPASRVAGPPPHTSLEVAVEAIGSLADFVLRAGRGVTLLLPQDEWRRTRLAPATDGRCRLLESLARVTAHADTRLGRSLRVLLTGGGRRSRAASITAVVVGLDRELVEALVALRNEGLEVTAVHVDAASFEEAPRRRSERAAAPDAGAPRSGDHARALEDALVADGVRCLTVRAGDDLGAVLSLNRGTPRPAAPRSGAGVHAVPRGGAHAGAATARETVAR